MVGIDPKKEIPIYMPTISVIVPVYNTERYLHRCVDSILAQTFKNFELLLIDDGSTDGSGPICDECAARDSRVRVFHKSNEGVSSARNLGLDNAQGEWITFCDSDDYVFTNWLANFKTEKSQDFDLLCQGIQSDKAIFSRNPFTHEIALEFDGEIVDAVNQLVSSGLYGYLFVKCFKRYIIQSNHIYFDKKVSFQEDELFLCEYLKFAQKVKSENLIGYYYFSPCWDKYRSNNISDIVYRTERILDSMHQIALNNSYCPYIIGKQDSLTLYLIEAFVLQPNHSTIKKIRNLAILNQIHSKIPKFIKYLIQKDFSYILLYTILLSIRLYRKISRSAKHYI